MDTEITGFAQALLFLVGGLVFGMGGWITSRILAPYRPDPEKRSSYECGEDAVGTAWVRFNMRFYVMGLIFLIFDVEILLLFPWAAVYADPGYLGSAPGWGVLAVAEALIFMGILLVGLIYIWERGDIDWVRPETEQVQLRAGAPPEAYQALNARLAQYTPQYPAPSLATPDRPTNEPTGGSSS